VAEGFAAMAKPVALIAAGSPATAKSQKRIAETLAACAGDLSDNAGALPRMAQRPLATAKRENACAKCFSHTTREGFAMAKSENAMAKSENATAKWENVTAKCVVHIADRLRTLRRTTILPQALLRTVRCSIRLTLGATTTRWTKTPGVWTQSGSRSPGSTSSSTSAMQILPAVAAIGLKLRAAFR